MKRNIQFDKLKKDQGFDFIVIGGGATGVGIALEAVTRGYSVALFEKSDFTKSTSSKSTKLVHGGVRYLAQGNVSLVREAAIERGLLTQNAPHLVKNLEFIIPTHGIFDEIQYTIGLKLYNLIAGSLSLGSSHRISKKEVLGRSPHIDSKKISAGVVYHDGQFDDSRLAINVLQSAAKKDAVILNYCGVESLLKNENGKVNGAIVKDEMTGETYNVKGTQVVNATGVFADDILKMDDPTAKKSIVPSQGVHLILDRSFLESDDAIMIPKTKDGRVLFLVPWYNKVVVGTTDTLIEQASLEPVALEKEIDFILESARYYLTKKPTRQDVLSVFAGLRPLAAPKESKSTKEISRSHTIITSDSGMLTMVGGKWTTFRKMGEELVDEAEKNNAWPHRETKTPHFRIHGYKKEINRDDPLFFYGTDEALILELAEKENLNNSLSDKLHIIEAQVVWAVRNEMAMKVEDVLARRTRCQLLDATESIKIAPQVAKIMAKELGKSPDWEKAEVAHYTKLTQNYLLS